MAKATRVHVRERRGTLLFDLVYQGIRCRESTGLRDSPDNRKRCTHEAQRIESEIALGQFDYVARFPEGNQRHRFSTRPSGDITFERFALDVWLPHMATKLRDMTASDYQRILQIRIFPHIGTVRLKDIRPEHIDQLTNYLKALPGKKGKLSPRRANYILLRARQVLDLAFEREYIAKNPHRWVPMQSERRPIIDPLSFEERKKLLQALPAPEVGARAPQFWVHYFTVAMDTGMRPNEQMALRWHPDDPATSSYVDFIHKKLVIRQGWVNGQETDLKTGGSNREIDMLPTVERVLRALQTDVTSSWVFPNRDGNRLNLRNLSGRVWYPALERAGLRPRNPYQTRHTFASLMLLSGEDPAWVAKMLGHTTLKMIYERYGKFIQNRTRQDGALYLQYLEE